MMIYDNFDVSQFYAFPVILGNVHSVKHLIEYEK